VFWACRRNFCSGAIDIDLTAHFVTFTSSLLEGLDSGHPEGLTHFCTATFLPSNADPPAPHERLHRTTGEGAQRMTMTSSRTSPSDPQGFTNAISWTAVQSGLWVGKANGEFAGMIEAPSGNGFVATTRLAKTLGVFATIEQAKASFRD